MENNNNMLGSIAREAGLSHCPQPWDRRRVIVLICISQ